MAASLQHFSLHDLALQDILRAFRDSDNIRRLEDARESAGNDMLRAMQTVFPVAAQIQMEVIEKYGFPSDGDGVIRFTQAVKVYEKQDQDVAQMNHQLRAILIPPIRASSGHTTNGSG
ncbi:protein C10-like isoform X2 [Dreissena polymorpha]|uniref:protein C10-like isoform X2 n=1 Tax=Dreissena polymorpha TaxID=45954 RepID=UPI0022644C3A|nr:protein C10-like isoform X2 [Dreissena polymorpha]